MKIRALAASLIFLLVPVLTSAEAPSPDLANAVRTELLRSWRAYEQYAWGHDELQPLSKTPKDWYGESLLMTPVDSLDALLLVHQGPEVPEHGRHVLQGAPRPLPDRSRLHGPQGRRTW